MMGTRTYFYGGILLLVAVVVAGCSSQPEAASAQPASVPTPVATTIQTVSPTTVQETAFTPSHTTGITTRQPDSPSVKQILHEKNFLDTTTYKVYDFKAMGYKFLYPGDKFSVTLTSEKPVLGYAVNTEQAGQLQALIPRYESYSNNIQWGLLRPSMIIEKATDSTIEFTVQDVGPLSYIVDGRWMSYDSLYDSTQLFTYELTILKISGPTTQNFDF